MYPPQEGFLEPENVACRVSKWQISPSQVIVNRQIAAVFERSLIWIVGVCDIECAERLTLEEFKTAFSPRRAVLRRTCKQARLKSLYKRLYKKGGTGIGVPGRTSATPCKQVQSDIAQHLLVT